MHVLYSPVDGVKLKTWSFSDGELLGGPEWKNGRPTYYIFYSHGLSPSPWEFWVELDVSVQIRCITRNEMNFVAVNAGSPGVYPRKTRLTRLGTHEPHHSRQRHEVCRLQVLSKSVSRMVQPRGLDGNLQGDAFLKAKLVSTLLDILHYAT